MKISGLDDAKIVSDGIAEVRPVSWNLFARAKIVISTVPVWRSCKGLELVLDRFDIARDGATAVRLGGGGIAIETVAAERGQRPWSVHKGDETAKPSQ